MIPRSLCACALGAVLAAPVLAEPAFEVPAVPCALLERGCGEGALRPVANGAWAGGSAEPAIRTVSSAGRPLRAALELGPRNVAAVPGTTVLIEIAIGHLNRIVTPFESPVVHTVSTASTQVDGSAVYMATASEEPVALYVADGPGSATALSLTLAPRYVPPREIRLAVPGYRRASAAAPETVAPALANADADETASAQPYVAGLVELLRAAARGRVPPGYRVAKGAGGFAIRCAAGLKPRGTRLSEGPDSALAAATVRNVGRAPRTLDPRACAIAGRAVAAAAAWPRKTLGPGEDTEIYLVVQPSVRRGGTPGSPR